MNGTTSQFPLVRLASKYLEMQKNGRLLSNRASVEILDSRILELADRIDQNQAVDRVANLLKLWSEYKYRKNHNDPAETMAMNDLDKEFERAYHDYASWNQLMGVLDLRRKMVESEAKVLKDIHAVLTVEDVYNFQAQVLAAIIATVNGVPLTDMPEKAKIYFMKRIQYEFTRLIGEKFYEEPGRGDEQDSDPEGGELDREGVLDPGNPE